MVLADLIRPDDWAGEVPLGHSGVELHEAATPWLRFKPQLEYGRPRSMVKLRADSVDANGEQLDGAGLERFYRTSWRFRSADFAIPVDAPAHAPSVIDAWHNQSKSTSGTPNVQWHVKLLGGVHHILVRVRGGEVTRKSAGVFETELDVEYDFGPIKWDRWMLMKQHTIWSRGDDGVFEGWVGTQHLKVAGPNLYGDPAAPDTVFWEKGIYCPLEGVKSTNNMAAYGRVMEHKSARIATTYREVLGSAR